MKLLVADIIVIALNIFQVSLKVQKYSTSGMCNIACASAETQDSIITFPEACNRCHHINSCIFTRNRAILHVQEVL